MIEATPYTLFLLLLGGAVSALIIFVACLVIFSHVTDTPVTLRLGPLKVRINRESE